MKKTINPLVIEIQRRFFQAMELAKEQKKTKGLKPFCEKHCLNVVKYYRIRCDIDKPINEMHYKEIDIDALAYLCEDFGVSPEWLLLGRGDLTIL